MYKASGLWNDAVNMLWSEALSNAGLMGRLGVQKSSYLFSIFTGFHCHRGETSEYPPAALLQSFGLFGGTAGTTESEDWLQC